METSLEIERKFLIEYPDPVWLEQQPGSRCVGISQTYLLSEEGESRRVRTWCENGRTRYFHTCKRFLTDRTRIEQEAEISREAYEVLLKDADPKRRTIFKTRWRLPYEGHVLEIDLYPFWQGEQAVLECELNSEDETFAIPPEIRLIREVTGDPRYRNSRLALEAPPSDDRPYGRTLEP